MDQQSHLVTSLQVSNWLNWFCLHQNRNPIRLNWNSSGTRVLANVAIDMEYEYFHALHLLLLQSFDLFVSLETPECENNTPMYYDAPPLWGLIRFRTKVPELTNRKVHHYNSLASSDFPKRVVKLTKMSNPKRFSQNCSSLVHFIWESL